jgi:membrane protease YdiL (CAAX protease family)
VTSAGGDGEPAATGSVAPLAHAWILVAAGITALLLRTRLASLPDSPRAGALALVLAAILTACLIVPVPRDTRRLAPAAGLAFGLLAIGVATWVSGPPVPLPLSAWALPLSVLAAVAEEALFRRVAFAWLERWGVVTAIVGSATLFALMHIPLYGAAVFPVDLGAGLLFSWQRWATGTWTVPATTHAAANLLMTVMR